MNPSEDPNDRLIDSLLREQAKGKSDEALLRAIATKMQAVPKAKSERRNLDFFWPATAATKASWTNSRAVPSDPARARA